MSDSEPVSLEFIEDPYVPRLDGDATPSLDYSTTNYDCNDDIETDLYLRNLTLDDIFYDVDSDYSNQLELQTVETEFIISKLANQSPSMSIAKRFRLKFFTTKKTMRDVKVTFVDFSKPYIAKISSSENYKKFLNIGSTAAATATINPTTTTHTKGNT
uniref:Uncharacterized protein n=1 Tax=Stomoxys calcitrans TaxID=35570 RepID=A0A1I8PS47_STOCA